MYNNVEIFAGRIDRSYDVIKTHLLRVYKNTTWVLLWRLVQSFIVNLVEYEFIVNLVDYGFIMDLGQKLYFT